MQIASHNTMTYLPPRHWWLRPFAFMARCQSKDVETQILEYGVRLLDLRVRFDKKGNPVFAHGQMEYKGGVIETIVTVRRIAASLREPIYVMVSLEWPKAKGLAEQEACFRGLLDGVQSVKSKYDSYTIFCGGSRKYDWHKVKGVELPASPSITQMVSSTTWKIWDDWFPWLYAQFMNKKNREKQYNTEFLSLDFVNI